ncbi:ribose transport system substrate-binding protein [Amycolatopsis sulphurea]|uniref:Ribose transport system substrate-binding protein n=1 Tax=Amycolatopsis sulphurea TaxID=76022 RepID=A0A2A9FJW0_9PSEU|nr:sugar ABC transporter substrate-binding protein [Amycolatopsis sulphurea]PFG51046.1 ribose transport system substrate-binding protein [Amycolatopsis sulphurea]
MKFRRIALGVALSALVAVTAACGGSSGAGKDGAYSIGIVQFSSSEETSETALRAYVGYAEGHGWKVTKVDPQGSVDKAISAMNDFTQKRVDVIVAAVFPSESLTAGIRAANAAGIPVISFAGGPAHGVVVDMDAGRPNGTEIAKLLVKDLHGTGNVLAFGNNQGPPCMGREAELMDTLKGTKIQVTRKEVPIPGHVEAATQFTQAWLAEHPAGSEPLAIFGCLDEASLGAISALRQARRDDVLVYGINGTSAALHAVEAGDMRADAFIDVTAAGITAAEQTPGVVEHGTNAEPNVIPIPAILVTHDTYHEFVKKHPEAVK